MNKAVIFDLDGTLLDSLPDIAYNVNLTLKHFNFPTLSTDEIRNNIGNGAKRLVKDCIKDNISEEQLNEYLSFYNKNYTKNPCMYSKPFDNVIEMLTLLKNDGYKLAILTNKPQQTTDPIYQKFFSKFKFDFVIGQNENVKCKPDKTTTLNILNSLNVNSKNAFFVGDGETDIQTAINSNITSISVLWGYRNKEQLSNAGAKIFASSPIEVYNIISNFNK